MINNDFDKAIEFINIAEEYLKGEVNAISLAELLQREVHRAEKSIIEFYEYEDKPWYQKIIDNLFGSKIHVSKISGNSTVSIKYK